MPHDKCALHDAAVPHDECASPGKSRYCRPPEEPKGGKWMSLLHISDTPPGHSVGAGQDSCMTLDRTFVWHWTGLMYGTGQEPFIQPILHCAHSKCTTGYIHCRVHTPHITSFRQASWMWGSHLSLGFKRAGPHLVGTVHLVMLPLVHFRARHREVLHDHHAGPVRRSYHGLMLQEGNEK